MAYKLNLKKLAKSGDTEIQLADTVIDFSYNHKIAGMVASNQSILKELYEMGKKYVTCDDKDCCKQEKCTKNNKVNGVKEKAVKKEKQVSAKASEKE